MRNSILLILLFFNTDLYSQSINKDSMNLIGRTLYNQMAEGFYTEPLPQLINYLEKAAPYFEVAENWGYYMNTLNYLNGFYYRQKDFIKFDQYTLKAIEVAERQFGRNSPHYVSALNNRSVSFKVKGDYANALRKYFEAIEQINPEDPKRNLLEAATYQNIGIVYREIGDFEEALRYLNKVLFLRLEVDNGKDADIPGVLRDLGQLFQEIDQIDSALTLYHRSLKELEALEDRNAYTNQIQLHCLQGIAEYYLVRGEVEEAAQFINQAIEFQRDKRLSDDYISYQLLGDLYVKKKQMSDAMQAYEQALVAAQREFEIYDRHPTIANCKENIGSAYLLQGDYDQALQWFQQALITHTLDFSDQQITSNPDAQHFINLKEGIRTLEQKAMALAERHQSTQQRADDLENAYACYRQAADLIRTLRKSYLAEGSKHTLAASALAVYEGAIRTALQLYEATQQASYLEEAFLFAEANKAVVLQESMVGIEAMGKADIPDQLLQKEDSLRIELTFYEQEINLVRQKKDTSAHQDLELWEQKAFELRTAYNELIAYFEENFPDYYEMKHSNVALSVEDLQRQMAREQSALIEFFWGEQQQYVFCLSGQSIQAHRLDTLNTVPEDIRRLRALVTQPPTSQDFLQDYETFTQLSHRLYTVLLGPVFHTLPSTINRLCIVPDDVLGYLPFELLLSQPAPDREAADYAMDVLDYLMEDFDISYNYSASLMLDNANAQPSAAPHHFLGMAPSFGREIASGARSCATDQLYSLQCSGEEVEAINQLVEGTILQDHQADKAAFLKSAGDYRICHLATHACLDDGNTQLNRIYFSDDYLSGYDLYNLQLNAELVVLSACNTGAGQMVKGEGIMSLSRGFVHAGCPSTLTSLWAVDDCATSDIMLGFYEAYTQGERKDKALQQARQAYLEKTTNKLYRHPYYWSAFIQLGNTDAASFYRAWWQHPMLWLAALLLFFTGFWISKRSAAIEGVNHN